MVNTMKKSMERSTFDPRGMLWVQLLNAGRLALRPARIGLSMLLLLLMALMWWLPTLWIEGEETPSYWVMEFSGEAFRAIQSGLLSLDAGKVHAGVKELFIDLPMFLIRHFPWTVAALAVPTIVVWTILGGAVTRSAAEEFSQGRRQAWTGSLAFSLSKAWSLFFAMVVPMCLIGGLALLIMGGGYVLLRIPGVNIAGGFAYGLLLLGGFLMLLLVIAFALGSGLLLPAVACEGADAIDATQRTYAYVLSRPVRTVAFLIVLLVQGIIIAAVLSFIVKNVVHTTADMASAWLPDETRSAIVTASTMREAGTGEGSPFGLNATTHIISLWSAIPGVIAGSILLSFTFSGMTVLYLLLRRVCDGQDVGDLWMPGMVAGTLTHEAVAERGDEEDED